MTEKIKKWRFAFVLAAALSLSSMLWLTWHPVEIVAVHHDGNFSYALVNHFPVTDRGKINWWLKNREKIKLTYNIPQPASSGSFNITFWRFGEGYKKRDKYDRLCFDDMQEKENCIEKEPLFTVRRFGHKDILFITYEGRYKLQANGEIVKVPKD